MLFNSYVFIGVFLPVVLGIWLALERFRAGLHVRVVWLTLASLVFYGYWSWAYVPLLLGSVVVNYTLAGCINAARGSAASARRWLIAGIVFNLGLLGWFKYTNFLVDVARGAGLTDLVTAIVLPIGISFFTFQQIAYLMDAWRGLAVERDPLRYALFVSFFPQLIAGPIVHHAEMMPQFAQGRRAPVADDLAVGLTIFVLGLAKKLMVADTAALAATPVFAAAEAGVPVGLIAAWTGALAYTVQIYFDFSGYSDMAVGLARMFGIRLPVNFASPYKATSIIDFWRRWHITLSRFLRDYLYVPLGGNRGGLLGRYRNVFITMLLGGIWHGAGWTFVLWGALHGALIVVNHAWNDLSPWASSSPAPWRRALAWALTVLAVILAWVPFRAETLDGALVLYAAMAGLGPADAGALAVDRAALAAVALGFIWAVAAPDTLDLMQRADPALPVRGYPATRLEPPRWAFAWAVWQPGVGMAGAVGALALLNLLLLNNPSEFLYFQF